MVWDSRHLGSSGFCFFDVHLFGVHGVSALPPASIPCRKQGHRHMPATAGYAIPGMPIVGYICLSCLARTTPPLSDRSLIRGSDILSTYGPTGLSACLIRPNILIIVPVFKPPHPGLKHLGLRLAFGHSPDDTKSFEQWVYPPALACLPKSISVAEGSTRPAPTRPRIAPGIPRKR
jgi:hypothetical protein